MKTDATQAHELVRDFANGDLNTEMSQWLADLVDLMRTEAINQGNKGLAKGSLTLKLSLLAECHGGRDVTIGINYDLTKKEPKPARPSELFFAKGKRLTQEHPRQINLDTLMGEPKQ